MSLIAERNQLVRDLESAVLDHCMCAKFIAEGKRYTVIYPNGFFPNGARVSALNGKAPALETLLSVMERHWQESMFWKQA